MNLIIDIGNSFSKLALFKEGRIIELKQFENLTIPILEQVQTDYPGIANSILSSVKEAEPAFLNYLENGFPFFIRLTEDTPLPIINSYSTPDTLGKDRIAAAVGASNIFPGSNVLIIDAGTALTFDLLTGDNKFLGGNISPGLKMRFMSLKQFTSSLPLYSETDDFPILGNSTKEAIISGVQHGMIMEIEGFIAAMKKQYEELKVILTGGDSKFFDKNLKSSIFVNQNLVLTGLNDILNFNVQQ